MTMIPALLFAVLGSLAIEFAFARQAVSRRPADLAIRMAAYVVVTLFWFQFSWRPWLAASTCLLTVAIVIMVDRLKFRVIGESLVFSDLALLRQVPRHPDLYYTLPLTDWRIAVPLTGGTAFVALWYWLEPTLLPAGLLASLGAILALPLAFVAAVLLARWRPIRERLATLFPSPRLEADVVRFGIIGTMLVYGLRRDGERVAPPVSMPSPPPSGRGDEVVIVIQLESFLDPTRLGGAALPAMARVAGESLRYGRLRVPSHGAYTMRSEHAILTGLDSSELGFAMFDPYLALGGSDPTSLARLAAAAGYETLFVHPYHRDFFGRAKVMSEFRFERLVTEEDFVGAAKVGPYIGDVPVAERILREVRERKGPLFLFCVTMENHGPWKPGRLAGIDDPLDQYLHHVANTGRAIEILLDGLAGTEATLCLFGDHPPSLPTSRPGLEKPQTEYAILRFGGEDRPTPERIDTDAAALGRVLRGFVTSRSRQIPG